MPRGKPFSGKKKKEQLKAKKKRKDGEDGGSGKKGKKGQHHRANEAELTGLRASEYSSGTLQVSLGKSGAENKLSTVFMREEDEVIYERKLAADKVLKTADVGKTPKALPMER